MAARRGRRLWVNNMDLLRDRVVAPRLVSCAALPLWPLGPI